MFSDDGNQLKAAGRINAHHAARLEQLRKFKEADLDGPRRDRMVTFKDLELLDSIDPETFKELTLTGWKTGKAKAEPESP